MSTQAMLAKHLVLPYNLYTSNAYQIPYNIKIGISESIACICELNNVFNYENGRCKG